MAKSKPNDINNNIRMINARHGTFFYNKNCKWIGHALEQYGEYCEAEVELFRQIVTEDSVVWEVGTNIGTHSVPLAKLCHRGYFVGFEPQVVISQIAGMNLLVNQCANAVVHNFGLGAETGLLALPHVDYDNVGNFGGVSLVEPGPGHTMPVEIRKMDDLDWLPRPTFIKIDVEGMEADVIMGGKATIEAARPLLYVENDREEKSENLISLLRSMDYDLYWDTPLLFNKDNFFANQENLYPNIISLNMFCVPRELDMGVTGFTAVALTQP